MVNLSVVYDKAMSKGRRNSRSDHVTSQSQGICDHEGFLAPNDIENLEDVETGIKKEIRKSPHMIVREIPAWLEPPKTGQLGAQRRSSRQQSSQPIPRSQSHIKFSNHQLNHQQNHQIQNAHYLNQYLNQIGSVPPLIATVETDSDASKAKGGGIHVSTLGYDNPGLILDSEKDAPAITTISSSNSSDVGLLPPKSATGSRNSLWEEQTLFFEDGIRHIDMVLVYEDDLDFEKDLKRKVYFRNLLDEELEVETFSSDQSKEQSRMHFVKIHAPWLVLVKYAEIMNMKMPIKEDKSDKDEEAEGESWWRSLLQLKYFDYNHDRIPPDQSFYMAAFNRQKEECFLLKDRETFFTSAQRGQIVWKILTRVRSGDMSQDKNGIRRLLDEKSLLAAYPLHEGSYEKEEPGEIPNARRLLYTEWAHVSNWYKRQPLGLVRRYFGDKIGLYFAWLGFYTAMLVPASIVGILCFLFGVLTVGTDYNTPSREICDKEGGEMIMCPLCGHCNLWPLDDSCTFSKLTYYFDNPATIFFSVFMACWATTFLEFWKRKHAVIAWEWDLHSYELEEETRPEFEAAVKTFRINPVTQDPEPFLSFSSKAARMLVVSSIVFLMVFIAVSVVVGIIIFRLVMMSVLYTTAEGKFELLKDNAKIISSLSAAIINLVVVVFLHDSVYYNVAIWLTNSEHPRTQTEYEDSFTFKMFLFQFINYYSYLIYIAFFKGRFFRHPGDDSDNVFEKIRGDMCDPAGCLSELFIQLATIMIGKQFVLNFMELFLPKLSNWFRRSRYKSVIPHVSKSDAPVFLTRWEQDFNLKEIAKLELFEEYLEMVIQYGFVTLFVAAFPLAPFFALLNNIFEIRLDAYKWTTQFRRPLAERVEDIGAWLGILQGLTYCSFCSNAFVLAYTSDIIPRIVYKYTSDDNNLRGYINSSLSVFPTTNYSEAQRNYDNVTSCRYRGYYNPPDHPNAMEPSDRYWTIMAARLAFVTVFEHLAFALTGVMAFAIPDMPREVNVQIQREKLLATEALFENDLAKLQREKDGGPFEGDLGGRRETLRRSSASAQDLLKMLNFNHEKKATQRNKVGK